MGGGAYRILIMDRYLNGVIRNIRNQGYCAIIDPNSDAYDEIPIRTGGWAEAYDIVSGAGYVRAGTGYYLGVCGSWF